MTEVRANKSSPTRYQNLHLFTSNHFYFEVFEISEKLLGAAAVVKDNKLVGIITDGDLRRMLMKHSNIKEIKAADIMTRDPKTIDKNDLAVNALELMHNKGITQLPVMENDNYVGMIHIHDIIKEGIL